MPAGRLQALRRAPSLLLVLATLLATLFAAPRAHAATDALEVSVSSTAAFVAPGSDVALTVEIRNPTSIGTSSGSVTVALSDGVLADPASIEAWMSGAGSAGPTRARANALPTAAGGSSTTGVTLPASLMSGEGVWGIQATVTVGAAAYGARTVVSIASTVVPADVSTIVAITAPLPANGVLDSASLAELTGPEGALRKALNAILGQNVTVAIDPRIIASIRLLGTQAPTSAVEWLSSLQNAKFDSFALQYGDADVALQAQLGLEQLLTPGDFLDRDLSASELSQLTAWDFRRTAVWPAPNTLTSTDIEVFATSGYSLVVAGSGNVADSRSALTRVGRSGALVTQDAPSAALARAFSATSPTAWQSATAALQAELAQFGGQRIVLAPNRAPIADSGRANATLALLANSPASRMSSLETLTLSGETSIVDSPESAERQATGAHLLSQNAAVNAFAPVARYPEALTEIAQRDLLTVLGTSWTTDPEGWLPVVAGYDAQSIATLNAVRVATSSSINVLASEASLPISVENDLDVPIDVWVQVSPSNGRIVVGEPVAAEIAAKSRQTVQVPVKARIGNGAVTLNVQLLNRDGGAVGPVAIIPANVQADWEGWGAAIIALTAAGLFGFGIVRQVRKMRRESLGSPHE